MAPPDSLNRRDLVACTTFGMRQWTEYAHLGVSSFMEHWPIPLVAYYQSVPPPASSLMKFGGDPGWCLKDLEGVRDFVEFRRRAPDYPRPGGSYRHEAQRFSHKVYAMSDLARNLTGGWLVWIDADVVTSEPPPPDFWERAFPSHASVSFLGRPWWRHSETGFVAFNLDLDGALVLEEMRSMYDEDRVFGLKEWHDAYVFDVVRKALLTPGDENDLAVSCPQDVHIWPHTILGTFTRHYKGPRKGELTP